MIRLIVILAFSLILSASLQAQDELTQVCPATGIDPVVGNYEAGGIILTSFDRSALWVYEIGSRRRYPLPDTTPCGSNCRLSPDARWITYFNNSINTYNRMRLNGTERSLVSDYASDIDWWAEGTFLIWTPGHEAYLQAEGSSEREYLDVAGVISVQPGGRWGVLVEQNSEGFKRALINVERRNLVGIDDGRVELGEDRAYFNAHSWSPDGHWLAYVAPTINEDGDVTASEIYAIAPGESQPVQWTHLADSYGLTRINGVAVGELSWSPDSSRIAFWVMEMSGSDPEGSAGNAVIHMLDVDTGETTVFCGYATTEHTPNPPRLIWSPDGEHIAFGGNVPGDERGYLLLALNTETGVFTELSEGIYPALGAPDVVAWGLPPG
jgi:Tol biopolymer transport system component